MDQTYHSNTSLLAKAALAYRRAGLSVVPTGKDKRAKIKWVDRQKNIPTEAQVKAEFSKPDTCIGIVTGAVSGNLEIIDFDFSGVFFDPWAELVEHDAPDLIGRLVKQQTQNGGYHIAYRCPDVKIPGNTKLAVECVPVSGHGDHEFKGKNMRAISRNGKFFITPTLIETRGQGGYFLVAPSPGYKRLQGYFSEIPSISPEERQILIESARVLNKYIPEQLSPAKPTKNKSYNQKTPGDDYDERGDVEALLQKHGWVNTGRKTAVNGSDAEHWRRPGKKRGLSATLIGGKRLYVFSTNSAPFEADRIYSPFAIYATLEHNGVFSAAAKGLSHQGYGSTPNSHELGNLPKYDEDSDYNEWDRARELFPRIPFPWKVLPGEIGESLQQLARSQATSPLSLPGAAIAIFGSVLGATVNVSPKQSWREPLIFWFADIRPSGSGKTPAARALCGVLYDAQKQADADYKQRFDEEQAKKPKDRQQIERSRSYFITDLTLEGLRSDTTGHGGSVCVLDELSSFISSQNQYKRQGNDREAWLSIHDGNPARIVRAKESVTIAGARISLFGGVQPRVWQRCFSGEKGLFLEDGTVYRFIPTFEGNTFYELTSESWSEENCKAWEKALTLAMEWADEVILHEDWGAKSLCLSEDAQAYFLDWRNDIYSKKTELPDQLKGFLPKLTSYGLRLSGVLYCMGRFATGNFPKSILSKDDVKKGVKTAMFYMGHIVDAMQALCSKDQIIPFEMTEQVKHLAVTLESLRGDVDNERLAVGHIQEKYNQELPPERQIKQAKAMGTLLRQCGLTIPAKKFRIKNRTGLSCLVWDKKLNNFLKTCQHSQHLQQAAIDGGSQVLTKKNDCQHSQHVISGVDNVAKENPTSTPTKPCQAMLVDNVDNVDVLSKEIEKFETGVI